MSCSAWRFHGQQYTLPVYGYHAWWRTADLTADLRVPPARREAARVASARRDLWLFKAPHHNFHLEAIVAAYPDARFVMTHRDPVKSVPSWASLVSTIFPQPQTRRDLHRLGREVSNHLREGVRAGHRRHAPRIGEDRFLDIHHRELVTDPMGTVRRVYDFLGLELTPAVEQTIVDWQVANRSGAQGHAPLHRRAVRPRPTRRSGTTTTSTSATSTSATSRGTHHDRLMTALPSWTDQMQALEGVGDNLHRDLAPDGATAAEVQDMNKLALSILAERLPVPGLHRRPAAGVHAAVELRVQPGRARPRLRVLDRRDRPAGVYEISGYRGTVALRRDHASRLRHDDAGAHAGRAGTSDATRLRPRRPRPSTPTATSA